MDGSIAQTYLSDVLHAVAQSLLVPDILLLLLFIGYALFCIGSIIAECLSERRHFRVVMPKFLAALMAAEEDEMPEVIKRSGLLRRQKVALLTVYDYRILPGDALVALIRRLVSEEESRYDRISGRNSMAARISPMLGLMGTLIPLGPGIQALGKADTAALSSSLLVAFDTTVAGLVVAAVCLVVGKIRANWYANYMTALDSGMATMLQKIEDMRAAGEIEVEEPSDYAFLYEGQMQPSSSKGSGILQSLKRRFGPKNPNAAHSPEAAAQATVSAAVAESALGADAMDAVGEASADAVGAEEGSAAVVAPFGEPLEASASAPKLDPASLPSAESLFDSGTSSATASRVAPPIEEVPMPAFLDSLASPADAPRQDTVTSQVEDFFDKVESADSPKGWYQSTARGYTETHTEVLNSVPPIELDDERGN